MIRFKLLHTGPLKPPRRAQPLCKLLADNQPDSGLCTCLSPAVLLHGALFLSAPQHSAHHLACSRSLPVLYYMKMFITLLFTMVSEKQEMTYKRPATEERFHISGCVQVIKYYVAFILRGYM